MDQNTSIIILMVLEYVINFFPSCVYMFGTKSLTSPM